MTYVTGDAAPWDLDALLANRGLPSVQRLLRNAAKPFNPEVVTASPPTYTEGVVGAVSTVNGNGVTVPNYLSSTANGFTPVGGPWIAANGSNGVRPASYTSGPGTRLMQGGGGFRFATFEQVIGLVFDARSGGRFMVYVTDPATGASARIAANDFAPANGLSEKKLDFGSRGLRVITLACSEGSAYFNGVNTASGGKIWPLPEPDAPRIGILWDSYGQGQVSDSGTINNSRLTLPYYLAARLGSLNLFNGSVGGTGYVSANGSIGTYRTRLTAGDFDISRIGKCDVIFVGGTLNDNASSDADVTTEMGLTLPLLRTTQPDALLVGFGPEITNNHATPQGRFDVMKAAWTAALGSDPNAIYLDNSPSGESWMGTGINSVIIGTDNTHLNKVGQAYLANRLADSTIAALRAKFGV